MVRVYLNYAEPNDILTSYFDRLLYACGGMGWSRKAFIAKTLPDWVFISKNRDVITNEEPTN
jgi:hypothetical protein